MHKKIFLLSILTLLAQHSALAAPGQRFSQVETCASTYQGKQWFMVKIGLGRLACYYNKGKNEIYSQKEGEYALVDGRWLSEPFAVGCLDSASACSFKKID